MAPAIAAASLEALRIIDESEDLRGRPSNGGFGGVRRAPDIAARNQAQAGDVLHRLVRRPVLAEAGVESCV